MLLQLGPVPTDDMVQWTRTARRILCEVRVQASDLGGRDTDDLLDGWSALLDTWATAAAATETHEFSWLDDIDNELAEFLLHGLDIGTHSAVVRNQLTQGESERHRPITLTIVQAFIDGLSAEGPCHEHLVDQVRGSFGASLDH